MRAVRSGRRWRHARDVRAAHADKPNLYHGLPENPEISATVKFWKGIWKPLAAVGLRPPSPPASSTTSASVRTARKRKRTIWMKRKTRCANERRAPSCATAPERINHWVTAFCFVLAAVSGLGFFFPSFNWLMHIMGTRSWRVFCTRSWA